MIKNNWQILSHQFQIEGIIILLTELNTAAQSMKIRYELTRKAQFVKAGLDKSGDRYAGIVTETSNTNQGLFGIGAALIIGVRESIKIPWKGIQEEEKLKFGPKVNDDVFWIELVSAASNFVRHGLEWREVAIEALGNGNFLEGHGFLISHSYKIEDILHKFSKNQRNNIVTLMKAGIPIQRLLISTGDYWYVANEIKLTDIEYTLKNFSSILDELEIIGAQKIEKLSSGGE